MHFRLRTRCLREFPHPAETEKSDATSRNFDARLPSLVTEIGHVARGRSWQPGRLHPNLSWTHYRTLLRVEKPEARAFYEIEATDNHWSARELERQINSLLFERLALSKDKKGLMRLATKGQEIVKPIDIFKDPVVIEFLGLPESPRLVESDLEAALLDNLQAFLLELGKGFAFVARQQRLTLDGDHFYIDLVFYHAILKCFVLIDLKTGKLTHQDLGQLQLYVNYYDRERRSEGDNPTLGLILCTDKNDAVVRYTLGRTSRGRFLPAGTSCICPAKRNCARKFAARCGGCRRPSRPVDRKGKRRSHEPTRQRHRRPTQPAPAATAIAGDTGPHHGDCAAEEGSGPERRAGRHSQRVSVGDRF